MHIKCKQDKYPLILCWSISSGFSCVVFLLQQFYSFSGNYIAIRLKNACQYTHNIVVLLFMMLLHLRMPRNWVNVPFLFRSPFFFICLSAFFFSLPVKKKTISIRMDHLHFYSLLIFESIIFISFHRCEVIYSTLYEENEMKWERIG